MSTNAKRPAVVSVMGILGIISGLFQVLGGLFIVFDGNRLQDFPNTGLTDTGLIWLGGFGIAVGAFAIFLASSLLSGQKWTRVWYAVIGSLNIVSGFWLAITHGDNARWTGLAAAILWIIILMLLFNDKSDKFFED
jgi:hypothetical protein